MSIFVFFMGEQRQVTDCDSEGLGETMKRRRGNCVSMRELKEGDGSWVHVKGERLSLIWLSLCLKDYRERKRYCMVKGKGQSIGLLYIYIYIDRLFHTFCTFRHFIFIFGKFVPEPTRFYFLLFTFYHIPAVVHKTPK